MRQDTRRAVLATALAGLVATAVAPRPASAADKMIDARKVFPLLDAYLKLPAAERSRFRTTYTFHVGSQPLTAPMWLVEGATRTPLPLAADGQAQRLPTLAQLQTAKLQIAVPEAAKIGCTVGLEPILRPAPDLDARELAAALVQAAAGVKKAAGVMALAMPKLSQISFPGVAAGEVVMADGRRAPLPLIKGVPSFKPDDFPTARTLHFPKAPAKLDMG